MVTHTRLTQYKDQSPNVITNSTEQIQGKSEINLDQTVAIAADVQLNPHAVSFIHANLVGLCLSCDQPVTVYTNNPSGSSPQDTIPLVAGQVLSWTAAVEGLSLCPFSGNVTTIYVTNASSAIANFKLRCVSN